MMLLTILVGVGWAYVVLLMTLVEATGPNGSLLGAFFTLLLYGALPLAVVLYLVATPARRAARRARLAADPDGGGHAAGDTVAPEREEP